MRTGTVCVLLALLVAGTAQANTRFSRKLTQAPPKVYQGTPASLTVSASNPNVNAITITPIIPYPQNAYFCNVTGDSRIPQQGPFPLTVNVPVGVSSTVIFANVTGPIPGTTCTGAGVVQQPGGSSVVQQQSPSSVVQQQSPSSVVQQQSPSSVVQQQSPSSVVQQQQKASSVVQQDSSSSVVQQQSPSSVVQQYASVNQQNPNATQYLNCVGNTSSVVQQGPPSSVVQQASTPSTPSSVVQQQQSTPAATPATVVQQQATPAATPTTVVQQQTSTVAQPIAVSQSSASASGSGSASASSSASATAGRHLLQVGTIEYISNNGSTGQPQLSVLDTIEGVPSITFTPTDVSQTATFNGALQVAVTTTHDGFGQPLLPYEVDSHLSPQCNVQVIFKAVAASG